MFPAPNRAGFPFPSSEYGAPCPTNRSRYTTKLAQSLFLVATVDSLVCTNDPTHWIPERECPERVAAFEAETEFGTGTSSKFRLKKIPTGIYGTFADNLRNHPWTALGLGIGVGAYSLAHGATALAAGMLARALATGPVGGELREGDELGQFFDRLAPADLVFLGLIAAGVKALASVSLTFIEARAAALVGDAARNRTIAALLEGGQRHSGAKTLATLSSRCREIEQAAVHGVIHGARALAQLVPLVAGLIFMSPRLALVGTLALLPFGWLLSRLRVAWRRAVAEAQDLGDELVVGVDDLVANLDLWRTYAAGARAEATVADAARAANAATAKAGAARAALSGFNEVLAVVGLFGAITLGPHVGVTLHDGVVFGFAVIFFMMYRPLRDLGDARGWLLRGSVALSAVGALSQSVTPAIGAGSLRAEGGDKRPHSLTSSSRVETPERLELRDFGARRMETVTTLVVEPGEIVALVGPTGSGKTSLLRAMLGLEPALGRLCYGGRDLSAAGIGPPDRPFAWVPQEAPLVADTLLGNVGLFSDTERAREALAWIGAARLQDELADAKLGPGGRPLSGGERRLVSVARALATGLPVLLLDEPTEGLDPTAAKLVIAALARLERRRTLLIVTHRTDVAAIADRSVSVGEQRPRARRPHVA